VIKQLFMMSTFQFRPEIALKQHRLHRDPNAIYSSVDREPMPRSLPLYLDGCVNCLLMVAVPFARDRQGAYWTMLTRELLKSTVRVAIASTTNICTGSVVPPDPLPDAASATIPQQHMMSCTANAQQPNSNCFNLFTSASYTTPSHVQHIDLPPSLPIRPQLQLIIN